jgi:lipopolysaccharide transport system ATP-binding protein
VSTTPVRFEGVSKKFRGGERHDSLRDLIPATIKKLTGRSPKRDDLGGQEFWALQDVSFEVERGKALGIIGPNGAGKSTTLKVLTRILRPTRGTREIVGRVGALIEVAAGFHPDLTGRENVYLQGAVMGMKRAEVDERFSEIVEFAGVSAFIDTQVKRYSSGMNARLGFAIAAHLRPDVLIIDEVLSVGDMAFQERCIERMRAFKREGVTIVFVSHNLQAITDLCDKALYLRRQVKAIGDPLEVIDTYVRDSFSASSDAQLSTQLRILSAVLVDRFGSPVQGFVEPGQKLCLRAQFEATAPLDELNFSFRLLRSTDQLLVYDGHFSQEEVGVAVVRPGEFTMDFEFDAHLTRGQYFLELQVRYRPTHELVARLIPAAHLTVAENRTWGGVSDLAVRSSMSTPAVPAAVI